MSHPVLQATLVAAAVGVGVAQAQSDTASLASETVRSDTLRDESRQQIEEVIVTGTRITRRDFASPSPVYTLSGDSIRLQGFPTVEEVLNRLPQFSPSFGRTMGYKEVEYGIEESSINLRGLGSERTLVLLDGTRLGAGGTHGVINTNVLPSVMMERVEVLTGGASSVYGPDAISGVVNFITRRDFTGFELSGNYEISDESDADVWSVNAAAGSSFGEGRGNISGFIDYYQRDPLSAGDRDFSQAVLQDDAYAASQGVINYDPVGQFVEMGSFYVPTGLIAFPTPLPGQSEFGPVTFDESGNPRTLSFPDELFNYAPYYNLQNELERTSGRLLVNYQFSDSLSGTLDFLGSHHEDKQQWAPAAQYLAVQTNLDNPLLTPANREYLEIFEYFGDGIAHIDLFRRFNELGEDSRFVDWESDNWRIALGLDGQFGNGWEWQIDYQYGKQDTDISLEGGANIANLQQGLLVDPSTGECFDTSNGCVPVNLFAPGLMSTEAIDFIRADPATIDSESEIQQLLLFTEGEVDFLLPLSLGFGVELRWEDGKYEPDPELLAGDVAGYDPVAGIDGDYDMAEAFVEVFVPLLRERKFAHELSLEAGLRYSDHSEVGDFWTWKSGLSWAPVASLRFRAMFQRATRAPNLEEMFYFAWEEQGLAGSPLDPEDIHDPCAAYLDPVGNGHTELCVAQGIPEDQVGTWVPDPLFLRTSRSAGNRDLDPEKADTWTVGVVWQPSRIQGLSAALDWYNIDIEDALQWIDSGLALDTCFEVGQVDSEYCQAFGRAADGNIAWDLSTYRNLSKLTSEGIDLQVEFSMDAPGELPGQFRLALLANWNLESRGQASSQSTEFECEGLFGNPCGANSFGAYPEYRTMTTLGYAVGDLSAQMQWHWIDEMENGWNEYPAWWMDENSGPLAADTVDSTSYFDLNASWQATEQLNLTAGIINLTDEDPPIWGSQARWFNTNSALYDTLGRRYHLSMRWRF